MTMRPIQHIELSSNATSIDFTNIPGSYTDLYLVTSLRSTGSATGVYFSFNSSTSDFSGRFLQGSGSGVNSGTDARRAGYVTGTDQTSNTFANNSVYISNYTASASKLYSVEHVQENNGTTSYTGFFAGFWNQSTVITSLSLTNPTGNMAAGSSATLYGILKGSDGITTVS